MKERFFTVYNRDDDEWVPYDDEDEHIFKDDFKREIVNSVDEFSKNMMFMNENEKRTFKEWMEIYSKWI